MAAVSHKMRTALSVSSTIYIIGILCASQTVRATLKHLLAPTAHPFRFLALVFALVLNAKSLPLIWHLRIGWSMFYQLYVQPSPLPKDALFRPIVTRGTRTSFYETDYNLHKSNSTYFGDLDIGRAALVSCLLRRGIRASAANPRAEADAVSAGMAKAQEVIKAETTLRTVHASENSPPPTVHRPVQPKNARFLVALGGVSCNFRRELKPYEAFDIWTRVLSWDRKWIYLVSHMVKPGTVLPDGFALQPWRKPGERPSFLGALFGGKRKGKKSRAVLEDLKQVESDEMKKAIFATSFSKYVVKKGRLTILPELVFERSHLLPPKPAEGDETEEDEDPHAWTWANVERERQRGWELAQHFAALDGAVDEFPVSWPTKGAEVNILGEYLDLANF